MDNYENIINLINSLTDDDFEREIRENDTRHLCIGCTEDVYVGFEGFRPMKSDTRYLKLVELLVASLVVYSEDYCVDIDTWYLDKGKCDELIEQSKGCIQRIEGYDYDGSFDWGVVYLPNNRVIFF